MNVISMTPEIHFAANSMIGESPLPHLALATEDAPEFVRVRALDQLNSPLDRHVHGGSQQEVNVFGHDHERVQFVTALAAVPINRLQEKSNVIFDDEQFSAIVRREGYEISSRRGDESSRLQGETSAAGSRTSLQTLNWHEWNSCPSRLFSTRIFSIWEKRSIPSEIEHNG